MKKLFLIDGNSLCYRAFYAIRELRSADGRPTNAVYGFVMALKKILTQEAPAYCACAFDLKGPTFRHKAYAEYKAHRKPMPDELVEQMPVIKEVVRAFGLPIYELEGFEADDVLATIATRYADKDVHVSIVTGDKDALQLVGPHCEVYSTNKEGLVYDVAAVRERYEIEPSQIVDMLALMGDSSDNVPGVPGVGEVTARKLIQQFGSLEEVLGNLDKVSSKSLRGKLSENVDKARMSKELVTVDTNVPLDLSLDDMCTGKEDEAVLFEMFRDLGFRSLLKGLTPQDSARTAAAHYVLIDTLEKFEQICADLYACDVPCAFDFETTNIDPTLADIVGISFAWEEAIAYYVPLKYPETENIAFSLDAETVLSRLRDFFEDAARPKVGQNLKYETVILKRQGITLAGIAGDTMIASYLLKPSRNGHDLDTLAREYLGYEKIPITDLIGSGKKQITMDQVPLEAITAYACEDSDITLRLHAVFQPLLEDDDLEDLYADIELPLVPILADMEFAGVRVDTAFLEKMSKSLSRTIDGLMKEIYALAGEEFNINSPKQLQVILFDNLDLPVIKRTKTGRSTDTEVLMQLVPHHVLPKKILEYRELTKLVSTYVDALPKIAHEHEGKVHTSFNQTITATGRLSSSQPNLQNIPVRTEIGRRIRKAFVASERGGVLLSCDYSQIELRILAHLSRDDALCAAFHAGKDIHTHTAQLIFDVDEKDVDGDMRAIAKTVNFGIVYGMSAFGLSRDLSLTIADAQEFIDNYFARYPRVKAYMDQTTKQAHEQGFVTTLFHRRRVIPELKSTNRSVRMFGERMAINTPIQGTASDIIKKAMIAVAAYLGTEEPECRMVLQVHDELVFDGPEAIIKRCAAPIQKIMEDVVSLDVPMKVNVKIGTNWLEME